MFGFSREQLFAFELVMVALLPGCTVLVQNKLGDKGVAPANACASDAVCSDGNPCNGDEKCDPTSASADKQGCVTGTALPEGQACDSDNDPTTAESCKNNLCARPCSAPTDCNDGDPCNGDESCDITEQRCVLTSNPLSALADCQTQTGALGQCVSNRCAPFTCGNKNVDNGEECDDGNKVDGDGCDTDCKLSCGTPTRDCRNDDVCTKRYACDDAHRCVETTPLTCDGFTPPNSCTIIACVKETKQCEYVPVTVDGEGRKTPLSTAVRNEWAQQYPHKGDCVADAACATTPNDGYGKVGPGYTTYRSFGYCQRFGSADAPTCYSSFDYNCDGVLTVNGGTYLCTASPSFTCRDGFPADAPCGEFTEYRTCSLSRGCDNPLKGVTQKLTCH